ncbi:MarR family transcriptional regulator [Dactylosporangium sp. CA-092794]|uniref:MarR family transcriptional regulator n=1 Tax=Dactylosporangium sp. CA-092794 TaxID=3239929 RepID=UPI003D89D1A0
MAAQHPVGDLLRRAQRVHTARWTREFCGELTGPQYAVLSVLTGTPRLGQRAAGELASLDRSSAADVMARLQRNGWVSRTRDDADGRQIRLALTAAARAALPGVTARVRLVQEALLDPLPPRARGPFLAALAAVAYAGDPPPPSDSGATGAAGAALALPLPAAPGHLIRRAEQLHRAHWNARVGTVLTPAQYRLLDCLSRHPEMDQSTAGEACSLDRATTVEIVARLARRDLIVVERDPADRRRRLPGPTDRARELLASVTPAAERLEQDLLRPLGLAAAGAFVAALRRLVDATAAHAAQ